MKKGAVEIVNRGGLALGLRYVSFSSDLEARHLAFRFCCFLDHRIPSLGLASPGKDQVEFQTEPVVPPAFLPMQARSASEEDRARMRLLAQVEYLGRMTLVH